MPRFTLLRLTKSFLLFWIALVGLWLFLPSPPAVPTNRRDHYIQTILTSGNVLHTVHKWHPSYASPDASGYTPRPSDDCSGLLIDWRLVSDIDHGSVMLDIGPHASLNLTDAILKSQKKDSYSEESDIVTYYSNNNKNKKKKEKEKNHELYVSDVINVHVPVGDENHVINMPWFQWSDMTLFHNQMHGFTYRIEIRIVARQGKQVEIWKSSSIDSDDSDDSSSDSSDSNSINLINPRPSDREFGILASFSNLPPIIITEQTSAPSAQISGIVVSDVKGELPSKTYATRSFLLVYLAPALIVCWFLLSEVAVPALMVILPFVVTVYILIVAICWCFFASSSAAAGQTGFVDWCARFWMTRCFFSSAAAAAAAARRKKRQATKAIVIWGPAGPVYDSERDETERLTRSSKRGR